MNVSCDATFLKKNKNHPQKKTFLNPWISLFNEFIEQLGLQLNYTCIFAN